MSDIRKLQQRASNPTSGIWVTANAGSGKTKVLTDRYLRLLLNEVKAEKILCITFTKAAAAEMKNRIIEHLREWSYLPQEELIDALKELGEENCNDDTLNLARRLFTELLDKAQALNITTIHSFCQSLLGRFPLECGIVPHFKLAEESMAQGLLSTAIETIFDKPSDTNLNIILKYIGNNEALHKLARKAVSERRRLNNFMASAGDNLSEKIAEKLQADLSKTPQEYLQDLWTTEKNNSLKAATKNENILTWCELSPQQKINQIGTLFTTTGSLRKDIKNDSSLADSITHIYEHACRYELHAINLAFLKLCQDIINMYDEVKQNLGRLDYDDLILKAGDLLKDSADRDWVAYKLDGGIDHILVDEAQDTNPEQWEFIKAIAMSLFENNYTADKYPKPSLFVVGDEKQSIYRFQRADVQLFNTTKEEFASRAKQTQMQWEEVELQTSFRSSQGLLQFVDNIFASDQPTHHGLSDADIKHSAFHETREGRIELLAPFSMEKTEPDMEDLHSVLQGQASPLNDSESKLADTIAKKIGALISKKSLPHYNRPITAGDIMILMRKRGRLMNKIIAALKKQNIPVAGIDRLRLTDHIAVQDLLALADFCLLPEDDLTCAAFLKSPFIGLDEEAIYHLCSGRGDKNLWNYLCQHKDKHIVEIVEWLKRRIYQASHKSRYEFFALALSDSVPTDNKDIISGTQAFAARLGDHAQEILQEFLDYAYRFESSSDHSGSLQEFLAEIRTSAGDVKQDVATQNPMEVRIMSIHAAKGLQSPIVILPDTMSRQAPIDAGNYFDFWKDASGENLPDIPLWIPKIKCQLSQELKAEKQDFEDQEYHRLLYVAMTRAESHLYIFGARGKQKEPKNCWYRLIASACGIDEATLEGANDGEILYSHGSETPARKESIEEQKTEPLPEFLLRHADKEETPSRPMTASHAIGVEPAARSPLFESKTASTINPFERGLIIHSLLQYLPDIAPTERSPAAENYLNIHAQNYDDETRSAWKKQVLNLMQNKNYADVFSATARSEVAISGYVDSHPVSARIDRLLIEENRIFIVDYKTNPNPPKSLKAVPPAYKKQMQLYAKLLRSIYPNHKIETALIWTHTAELMLLE